MDADLRPIVREWLVGFGRFGMTLVNIACVYCSTPLTVPGDPCKSCGAPCRSAFSGRDEHGRPYPGTWPP